MKRRSLGLLAGSSLLATGFRNAAQAQTAPDPNLLKTTLTPWGAERAGNAEGTIPAWAGGYDSKSPDWTGRAPDFIASEQPTLTIDSSNVAQHSDKLSDGVVRMIEKFGFSIKVYPTHRTAALPQYIYDNTALNVTRATLVTPDGRNGFEGAYGGVPFPIIDPNDPAAGAKVIMNHNMHYLGYCLTIYFGCYTVNGGQVTFSDGSHSQIKYPYYDPKGSAETFNGIFEKVISRNIAPSYAAGGAAMLYLFTNTQKNPSEIWSLLAGQGRVRKAPDDLFDAPVSYVNGVADEDEQGSGFNGSMIEYNWKFIGKKEVYIPYHCNKILETPSTVFVLPTFPNPDIIRWELHRVWVVEATVAPGYSNTLARRVFYVDEDMWCIHLEDGYDASGNMIKEDVIMSVYDPQVEILQEFGPELSFNVQTGDYSLLPGKLGDPPYNAPSDTSFIPDDVFDPQTMAAQSSY